MKLREIKQLAKQSGACFLALRPGAKLPMRIRGKSGGEGWLCVARGTDRTLIAVAAARFDKVRIFNQVEFFGNYTGEIIYLEKNACGNAAAKEYRC